MTLSISLIFQRSALLVDHRIQLINKLQTSVASLTKFTFSYVIQLLLNQIKLTLAYQQNKVMSSVIRKLERKGI